MNGSLRLRLGIWLGRFRWLHPVIGRYSHEYPEGRKHYINRVSGTFLPHPKPHDSGVER